MLLEGCEACVTADAPSEQQRLFRLDMFSIEEEEEAEEVEDETPVLKLSRKRKSHIGELLEIQPAAANATPKKETDAERSQRLSKIRPGEVPAFDRNAKGNPHEWNYGRNSNQWLNEKRKRRFLNDTDVMRSTLEHSFERMKEFMHIREDAAGTSMLKKLKMSGMKRIGLNQWRLPWREFEEKGGEENLFRFSDGPFAKNGRSEWVTAFHGCKMEGLYSIMMHGRLRASKDKGRGDRYHDNAPGVYCHEPETQYKVWNYARFVPMFKDGFFWSAMWELKVDRSQQYDMKHAPSESTRDQWSQREESVRLAALWLVAYSVQDLPHNTHVIECWDPLVEGNPHDWTFEKNASDADDGQSARTGSGFLAKLLKKHFVFQCVLRFLTTIWGTH